MAADIGPKIGIQGEAEYRRKLNDINQGVKTLASEMKVVTSAFENNADSLEALTAKNDVLERTLSSLNERLELQEMMLKESADAYGEADERTQKWQQVVNNTQAEINRCTSEIERNNEAIDALGSEAEETGEEMFGAGEGALRFADILKANLAGVSIEKVIGKLRELIEETAEYGDMVDKSSQKLGISAKAYQEWDAVLQHSGTSMSSMSTAFKTLADAVQDTSADQERAFRRLGLSLDDLKHKSTEDIFSEVIAALQNMESGTERTTTATDLLGRGAMELGALLNTSAEDTQAMIDKVNALGGVMSEKGVKASAAYQDSVQDLKTAASAMARELATDVLPVLTELFNGITDLAAKSRSYGFDDTISGIDSVSGKLEAAMENLQNWQGQLDDSISLMGLMGNGAATMAGGVSYAAEGLEQASEQLAQLRESSENQAAVFREVADGTLALADAANLLGVSEDELRAMMEAAAVAADGNADAMQGNKQALTDIAGAAYTAIDAGDDLRASYEELSGQLESLEGNLDESALAIAEQALAALDLAATNQELVSSYPGFVDAAARAGQSVSELSKFLIDNGVTAEEWGSRVKSAVDGIINKFDVVNTDLGKSLTDMASGLQENISAYNDWNSNIQTLMDAAVQSGDQAAVDFVNYMQSLGVGAADQVSQMVQDVDGALDTFAPLFAEAAEAGVLEVQNSLSGENAQAVSDAVSDMIDGAKEAAESKAEEFSKTGEAIAGQTASGVDGKAGEVAKSAEGAVQSAVSAAQGQIDQFRSVGYQISAGIAAGVQSGSGAVAAAVRGVVSSAVAVAKAAAVIESPSKLFRDEVGYYMGLGIAKGIEDAETEAEKAADQLAGKVYSASQKWISRTVKYARLTTKEELALWKQVQAQFVKGSEQFEDAYEKIFDLKEKLQDEDFEHSKNWIEKQVKYYDMSISDQIAAWERVKARFAEGTEQYAEAVSNIFDLTWQQSKKSADALQERAEEIYNIYGLFDEIPERERKTGQELAKNLQDQVNNIRGFFSGLEDLSARGVSDTLIKEIRAMGPAALDELNALLSMTDVELNQYADLYAKKQQLANDIALDELKTLGEDTQLQITQNLTDVKELYGAQAPDVGIAFTDGLAKGINTGMSSVINAAIATAQAALAATKKTLGIHSPSTVFAEVGNYMAEGLADGFIEGMREVEAGMTAAIPIPDISLADAASGIVNGLSAQSSGYDSSPRVVQLVLNSRVIAEETIDDLFLVGAANGTPLGTSNYA